MDETTPLLRVPSIPDADWQSDVPSKDLVQFDPDGDPDNPVDWPAAYKWGIVALLAAMAFVVTFTCISLVPIAGLIVDDLDPRGAGSAQAMVLMVTIWELGEAAGPLFIAPLSELFGRWPVMNTANLLFIAFTALSALAPSTGVLVLCRALTGAAVASNVLSPAIVGDLFPSERRGAAMSLVSLAPLVGGAVGPAVAGAISQRLHWRVCVCMSVALALLLEVLFLVFFRETYKVPLLKRKAARLRRETGNQALRCAFDRQGSVHSWTVMWDSALRPLLVFRSSFVLQILAFYGSFLFSYFYVMNTTISSILQNLYGFRPVEIGFAFVTFSVGSVIGVAIVNKSLDRIYIKLRDANDGVGLPEHRLPLVIVGAVLFPFTVALYGWAAQLQLHVSVLLLSVTLMGTFLMMSSIPLMAYVVDAFNLYSASSITALIVTRCLMGTFLPLTARPVVRALGYGWGMTLFAAISMATVPIPLLVLRYGQRWRTYSKYT